MYTKLIQSGNVVEVYQYEKSPNPNRSKFRKKPRTKSVRFSRSRRVDNVGRLRNAFIRLVRSNIRPDDPPAFLTLTMYEATSIKRSYKEFRDFVQRLRYRFGKEFRYIAVPEFQKRGAVHFHVLIWGKPCEYVDNIIGKTISEATFQETDSRCIQNLWGVGTCDCFLTDNSPKLAGYLAKYMSKSVLDTRLGSEKAYSASRNIMRPVSSKIVEEDTVLEMILGVDNFPLQVRTFDTIWLGRATYKRYNQN